eukprot:5965581-Pyramimonas_sp.AAC.1
MHDSTTLAVLGRDSPLRGDVLAMSGDGLGMSEQLEAEVNSIKYAPLDDTVAEGPHALAQDVHRKAYRAIFPWIASTM